MKIKNIKIYPLSDGDFVVSYFDEVRAKRVVKKFTDESDAKSFVTQLKTLGSKKNEFQFLKSASVETAIRSYFEQNPGTYFERSPKLVREFLDFFAAFGVPRLTEEALRSFFIYIKNEGELSDRSLLSTKSRLEGFFKFLIAHDAVLKSPLDNIKFNRRAPYKRKPITFSEKEIEYFIETARVRSPALFYPIFLLIQETAAKRSDILSLLWKDINFKERKIALIHSKELQARSSVISDRLTAAIQSIPRVSNCVFTNIEGRPLRFNSIGRELKRFQRFSGLDTTWNLSDLRFSFGINFLKAGGSYSELQKIMGHKTPYNTAEIYGRFESLSSNFMGSAAVQESGDVT